MNRWVAFVLAAQRAMNRWVVFVLAAVILVAATIAVNLHVRFAFNGAPHHTQHMLAGTPVDLRIPSGTATQFYAGSGTREYFKAKVELQNDRPVAERYLVIVEYRDYRGQLVHRHVAGPLIALPHSALRFIDRLEIPKEERKFISHWKDHFERID